MKIAKGLERSARLVGGAVLAAGILVATTGCDPLDAAVAVAQRTAVDTVQDAAEAAIQDAVTGVLGSVMPGASGG